MNGIAISHSARFNFQLKEGDLIDLVSLPGDDEIAGSQLGCFNQETYSAERRCKQPFFPIKGGSGVEKRGNFFKWGLLILGVMIIAGLWGLGVMRTSLRSSHFYPLPPIQVESLKNALQSRKPVLVDFGSNKCIPCRQIRPVLKEISQEFNEKAHVLIIDVFEYGDLAREYRIQLIPTLVFFNRSGKEIFRHSGTWDKNSIVQKLGEAGMS